MEEKTELEKLVKASLLAFHRALIRLDLRLGKEAHTLGHSLLLPEVEVKEEKPGVTTFVK